MDASTFNSVICLAVFFIAIAGVSNAPAQTAQGEFEFAAREKVGVLDSELIDESSGLAASRTYPDRYWTHNDNGTKPGLFLIDLSGKHWVTVQLDGAPFVDWEDVACVTGDDGRHYVVLGDIGDNVNRRDSYRLYVFEEPAIEFDATKVVQQVVDDFRTITFVYPNGSRDCEAMAVDPVTKEVWLITREFPFGHRLSKNRRPEIYRIPLALPQSDASRTDNAQPIHAELVGEFSDLMVTGMDIAVEEKIAIVRNYLFARVYARKNNESWRQAFSRPADATLAMPPHRQSEAVCFDVACKSIMTTSETTGQPIWKINITTKPTGK